MIQQDIKVINQLGLHTRPAALLAQTAANFACDIQLSKDGVNVNAKSIMGLMMLAAECGSFVTLTTNGSDEKEAFDTIKNLFDNKFNEEF